MGPRTLMTMGHAATCSPCLLPLRFQGSRTDRIQGDLAAIRWYAFITHDIISTGAGTFIGSAALTHRARDRE